jgi:hypothetical protein
MELSPAPRRADEGVLRALSIGNIVGLWGSAGMGKTTFLTNKERCAQAEAPARQQCRSRPPWCAPFLGMTRVGAELPE